MPTNKMCRICLFEEKGRNGLQPLFDDKNARCAEIVQRIEECSGIALKLHEQFPKSICFECLDSLNTAYKFRIMCQSSEQVLIESIVKSELKTEQLDSASTSHYRGKGTAEDDEEDDIFFDLRSDFIEAQEVDFDEISETKPSFPEEEDGEAFLAVEEIDMDEIDGEEHLNDSDSENDVQLLIDDDEFVPIQKKKNVKVEPKIGIKKKIKQESDDIFGEDKPAKKATRGRKRADAEPETNICEICGNIYTKRSQLNMHMRRHRSEKPFKCEICGKQFTCPSEIGRHIRTHTGEKPYICRFCGRTFADRSTNIKHERIHTNERPFTCQTCGKSFTYSNVLKNHMLTHTGEKPFLCKPCNKTFSRKHQLEQHLSTNTHQQTLKNLLPPTVQLSEGVVQEITLQVTTE